MTTACPKALNHRLIWSDLSSYAKRDAFDFDFAFSLAEPLILTFCAGAAAPSTEGSAATVDHTDIRGLVPHNMCPSGAASIYWRESRVVSCQ